MDTDFNGDILSVTTPAEPDCKKNKDCNNGEYYNNGCQDCNSIYNGDNCIQCSGYYNCDKCKVGFQVSDGVCVKQNEYYTGSVIKDCPTNCISCNGDDNDDCLGCASGYTWVNGECIKDNGSHYVSCKKGYKLWRGGCMKKAGAGKTILDTLCN